MMNYSYVRSWQHLEDKTLGQGASKHWDTMRKHIDWFIKNNPKAYMVLLD